MKVRSVERDRSTVPVGRHPRDLVKLLVAAGVVVLCLLAAQAPVVNPVEAAIFQQFQQIPAASTVVWRVLVWAGSWVGIAAVAGLALYLKRIRLGLQCVGAGAFAWATVGLIDG